MLDWLKRQIGIPALEDKLAALQTKVEQLYAQLASDQSQQKLTTLRERLESLESKITISNDDQTDRIDILRGRLDRLEQRVTSGLDLIEQRVTSDLDRMEQRVTSGLDQLGKLEQRVTYESEVMSISAIADQVKQTLGHSITFTSPDGKQSISLIADDNCSGIWIAGQKGEPMVALYKMAGSQGAVVGLYGPADEAGHRRGGLDACFYYDTTSEDKAGAIQLLTAENHPLLLELAASYPLGSFAKFSEAKFVGYIPPDLDER